MTFNTNLQIDKWCQEHLKLCKTRAFDGGQFEYTFIPTAMIQVQKVKCLCCGANKVVYND